MSSDLTKLFNDIFSNELVNVNQLPVGTFFINNLRMNNIFLIKERNNDYIEIEFIYNKYHKIKSFPANFTVYPEIK